jgi:hypothetical protein
MKRNPARIRIFLRSTPWMQVMDISDMAHPRFLGKFGAARPDGTTFEFAAHEVSFSPDGHRMYAGVNSSKSDDLNQGNKIFPPNKDALGPNGGGVFIFDNTASIERRPNPKLRLLSAIPGGGWHSVLPARSGGANYLVGGLVLENRMEIASRVADGLSGRSRSPWWAPDNNNA